MKHLNDFGFMEILERLSGGDLRSIADANQVVALAEENPAMISFLCECLSHTDRLIRMRSADALEKVSTAQARKLQPHKKIFLKTMQSANDKELRWHMAQIVPRLTLTEKEAEKVYECLINYREDTSKIVKTFALQGMVDLSKHHPQFEKATNAALQKCLSSGSPAEQARAKKLISTRCIRRTD